MGISCREINVPGAWYLQILVCHANEHLNLKAYKALDAPLQMNEINTWIRRRTNAKKANQYFLYGHAAGNNFFFVLSRDHFRDS